jgi:toxin-antitoxin system PIN domain toxin
MVAVDTNILVYAHRADSEWHDVAKNRLCRLAENPTPWSIPWPCLAEFYSVTTHTRIYKQPTSPTRALEQIEAWLSSPSVILLGESPTSWTRLKQLLVTAQIRGSGVHDARIAALCLEHGVSELWSADKDFSRYPSLKTRNPLL